MTHSRKLSPARALEQLKIADAALDRTSQEARERGEPIPLVPCRINLELFQDLAYDEPISQARAEELCAGCPLLEPCYNYGRVNKWAIDRWGGADFGREPRAITDRKQRYKNKLEEQHGTSANEL